MSIGFCHRESCPLCGSDNSAVLSELSYRDARLVAFIEQFYHGRLPLEQFAEQSYRVVRCARCDFIYQDMILDADAMRALYEDWIDHDQSLQKKQAAKARLYRQYAGQLQTLLRLFGKRPDQVRILEYGAGWGYWSRMAQAHGFDVSAYELSTRRRAHARGMGLELIGELPAPGPVYDCIYANQVFEHLPDPLETLRALRARLVPGGIVYLRVPDGRGVARRLTRRGWSPDLDAVHPLEHINCFTRKTLIRLAQAVGLVPFDPPLRLNWGSIGGGLKREFADRFLTTHVYFRATPDN